VNGTTTIATFRKFARELRSESALAADDQPLGSDLATAAAEVAKAGNADTNTLAADLFSVSSDCGQA